MKFQSANMKKYGLIPGTGLVYRGVRIRYPSVGSIASAGEDSVFSSAMIDENDANVELLDGMGYMHVYSYHGKNVWDIEHHMEISRQRSMNIKYMTFHRERICRTLRYHNFGEVKVMGREGLAFIYNGET